MRKKNGSTDPYEYWTENYIKLAARALGELAARTGLQFDSPHSQNFLVELDENMKPTGRLVMRDLADLYVDTTFIKAIEGENSKLISNFTQKSNLHDHIAAAFGPLHGNIKPAWVPEDKYSLWKDVFFKEFEKSFLEISGYDLRTLNTRKYQDKNYFSTTYKLGNKPQFNQLYEDLKRNGYTIPLQVHFCSQLFQ